MRWLDRIKVDQLRKAQTDYLRRLLDDKEFATDRASWLFHAGLGKWVDRDHGSRVLEVGCGPGRYAALLQTLGFAVTAVDPFRFPEWDIISTRGSVKFLDGIRAEDLPFPDESFDHVTCIGTLLYVNDVQKSLAEMKRVLRPGGRILIRTVNRGNLYTQRTGSKLDVASNHLFTLPELVSDCRKAGFDISNEFLFGYLPSFAPGFWWYLSNVWLSDATMERLGSSLRPESRHHCIVWGCRP